MSLAVLSLVLLAVAIIISCVSPLNIGFLCIAFAYVTALFAGVTNINTIVKGFPLSLFVILVGVTLLFAQAQTNGTLDKLTKYTMKLAKGRAGLLPIIVFFLTMALSALGPGNIAMIALIAPIAMAIAGEARISALMMAIMVVNGANAGAFSPIAPTGLVSSALIAKQGLPDISVPIFINNIIGNFAIGMLAYVLFGGLKLWKSTGGTTVNIEVEPFTRKQWMTIGAIGLLVILVVGFKFNVGLTAFAIAVAVSFLGLANESESVKAIPWNVIMMICGVSILMETANAAGGLDIFTTMLAKVATPFTVTGMLGFVTGVISAYSSSSGVVMPAFIPLVPGLIAKMGGGDPIAMISSINLGAHVVDASPLSVGGALCIGSAAAWVNRDKLFRDMMVWGLSMSVVGATVCFLFFSVL